MESALLEHHIRETERRFREHTELLLRVDQKLDNIYEFKLSLIATTRATSFIVSGILGFLTLVVTTALSWFHR